LFVRGGGETKCVQYQTHPCPEQLLLSDFFGWLLFLEGGRGLKEKGEIRKRESIKIEGVEGG
jgi:hypothetical protein